MWDCKCVIVIALLTLALIGPARPEPKGFIVTAPARFGSEEAVCISFKNPTGSEAVSVTLLEHKSDVELVSVEKSINGSFDCLNIRIPTRLPHSTPLARLLVRITDKDSPNGVVNAVQTVSLIQEPWLTFIATDKPVYGSKDLVRIRIFSVKQDFYPLLDKVDQAWVENPQGVHVGQWQNVKPIGGFIDLSFLLVSDPFPGTWAVKVSRQGHVQTRTFLVKKHELPRFQVNLTLPDVMQAEVSAPITVCSRYTFGRPVQGTVLVTMAVECMFKYYCLNNTEPATLHLSLGKDGCVTTDIVAERAEAPVWQYILLNATVEESDTGVLGFAAGKLRLIPPGAMHLVAGTFRHASMRYKPGLPFFGKFELTTRNKTRQPNVTVEMCLSMDDEKWCTSVQTDINGQVPFVLPPRSQLNGKAVQKISVEASWTGPNMKQSKKHNYLLPWISPSSSYAQIQTHLLASPLKCGHNIKIHVVHTLVDEPSVEFYVMVKSRGNIQLFELAPRMPDFEERQPPQWDIEGGVLLGPKESSVPASRAFSFSLPVSAILAPSAALVIYTVRHDGEVVADSAILDIEHWLATQASVSWNVYQDVPGADVSLRIESEAGSVCAVSAVDKNVDVEVPSVQSVIYRELSNKYRLSHVSDPIYDKDKCIKDESYREVNSNADSSSLTMSQEHTSVFVDSLDAFESSGLLVVSDLLLVSRPCRDPVSVEPKGTRPAHAGSLDVPSEWEFEDEESNRVPSEEPIITVRSNFPDTWIWNLVHIGESGIQEVKANLPHSVTEWTARVLCLSRKFGLTEAQSQAVRSFQPFFLDFSLPPAIRRHEMLLLPVIVFNYMDTPVPVMVAVEPSEHLHVRSDLTSSACVAGQSKAVVTFRVVPVKLGAASFSIKGEIDPHAADECGPVLHDYKVDHVMKSTIVRAEGHVIEEVHSALICGKDERTGSGPQPDRADWNIKMSSPEYVDQTVSSEARVLGDIFGPPLMGVEKIIHKPTGCGEQNMMALASNVLLVRYLLNRYAVSLVADHVTRALRFAEQGYQQQLSFRHADGSYSAFGPTVDSNGSLWLTAFVSHYFNELKTFVKIDQADLDTSWQWILQHQLENGCFPMMGEVYHWDTQRRLSGADAPRALTAFILIALLKSSMPASSVAVKNAIFCVQAAQPQELYADLLTAYALALTGEDRDARWRMRELLKAANRSYQTLWWQQLEGGTTESSIEMTSYGVLTLLKLGTPQFLSAAADAVRWIVQFQNKNGGFLSTQDTIVALEALAEYSATLPRGDNDLNVTVEFQNENKKLTINNANRQLQQTTHLPPFLTHVYFRAEGSGCALVQTVLKYNVRRGSTTKTLKLQLRVDAAEQTDAALRRVEACLRTLPGSPDTGMALLEINLPTGFYPDRASLYRVSSTQKGVKKFEEFEDHVDFYLDKLTNHKQCVSFIMKRELCVDNPSSVLAKVYDYYNSKYYSSVRYQIHQSCNDSNTLDSWLMDEHGSVGRNRRDIMSKVNTGGFMHFTDVNHDLDEPNFISNPIEIFAMPPPTKKENHKCPQCFPTAPDIFPKIYCSTQLAAKIRFRGKHILEVLQDLSPRNAFKNSTEIRKTVSYTMKRRCSCDILSSDESLALLIVTPPRTFNLRAIQVIHLDDSITLFPWNSTSRHIQLLSDSSASCFDVLTTNT